MAPAAIPGHPIQIPPHSLWTEEWEAIITNLPPHCTGVIADLARQFADLWTDFATRATRDVAEVG